MNQGTTDLLMYRRGKCVLIMGSNSYGRRHGFKD